MDRILVTFRDPQGLPRAWAAGPSKEREAIVKRACRELDAYVSERLAVGEPARASDFTRHEEPIA